jgi:hypothetical protein
MQLSLKQSLRHKSKGEVKMSQEKDLGQLAYHDNADAPAIAAYGTNWVMVECPSSEEEEERTTGRVEGRLKNNTATTWVLAEDAYYEPFDGMTRLDQNPNIPASPAGNVQYRTYAEYDNNDVVNSDWIDV